MIYNALWLKIIPGNREKAIGHLQDLAKMVQDEYDVSSRISINLTNGPVYDVSLVTAHENMASMVSTTDELTQSKGFGTWFEEANGLFDWSTAEWVTLRALRAPKELFSNFSHYISVHITPGNLMEAREHMGKLADHFESKYGRPVHILSREGGMFYRHHIVVGYNNLEEYEAVQAALPTDETYGQWAVDMMGMFDNSTIETTIFRFL